MHGKNVRLGLLGIFLGISSASHAAPSDLLAGLNASETAVARILVSAPGLLTRVAITEERLPISACNASIRGTTEIAVVLELLEKYIVPVDDKPIAPVILRNAVYLTKKDGTQIKILLGPTEKAKKMVGSYKSSSAASKPFEADRALTEELAALILKQPESEIQNKAGCVQAAKLIDN